MPPSRDNSGEAGDKEVDSWVQCDKCSKWRRVPKGVVDALGDDDEW